jgi:hypothetical protein
MQFDCSSHCARFSTLLSSDSRQSGCSSPALCLRRRRMPATVAVCWSPEIEDLIALPKHSRISSRIKRRSHPLYVRLLVQPAPRFSCALHTSNMIRSLFRERDYQIGGRGPTIATLGSLASAKPQTRRRPLLQRGGTPAGWHPRCFSFYPMATSRQGGRSIQWLSRCSRWR